MKTDGNRFGRDWKGPGVHGRFASVSSGERIGSKDAVGVFCYLAKLRSAMSPQERCSCEMPRGVKRLS
jgi:hypothetical protein